MTTALVLIFAAPWVFIAGYLLGRRKTESEYPKDDYLEALMAELRPENKERTE